MVLALISVGLTACFTVSTRFVTGLSAEERALAAKLPVYRETLPEGSYQLVGSVTGLSCQTSHDDRYQVSEENALEELKRATFKAGGNAVMEVDCTHFDRRRDPHGCFLAIECRGRAVQIDSEETGSESG